jgi:hypothetical protein
MTSYSVKGGGGSVRFTGSKTSVRIQSIIYKVCVWYAMYGFANAMKTDFKNI